MIEAERVEELQGLDHDGSADELDALTKHYEEEAQQQLAHAQVTGKKAARLDMQGRRSDGLATPISSDNKVASFSEAAASCDHLPLAITLLTATKKQYGVVVLWHRATSFLRLWATNVARR